MLTSISTAPPGELDYTNPNGIPDRYITEKEARLWLLSQGERASGGQVAFNDDTERWERASSELGSWRRCEGCPENFRAIGKAKYHSPACRQHAYRARENAGITGGFLT